MKPLPLSAALFLFSIGILNAQDAAPAPAEAPVAPTLEDRIGELERKLAELQGGKPAPMTSIIQELEDEEQPAEEGEELKLPRDLEASLVDHAQAGLSAFLEAFAVAPQADKWSYAVSVQPEGSDDRVWISLESVGTDGMLHGRKREGFLGAESEEETRASMTDPVSVPSNSVIDWSFILEGKKIGDHRSFAVLQFMVLNMKMRKAMMERYPENSSLMKSIDMDSEESLLTTVLEDYSGL